MATLKLRLPHSARAAASFSANPRPPFLQAPTTIWRIMAMWMSMRAMPQPRLCFNAKNKLGKTLQRSDFGIHDIAQDIDGKTLPKSD